MESSKKSQFLFPFRIALIPHSIELNKLSLWIWNCYKNNNDLEGLLSTVKRFSHDVGMQLDLKKIFESRIQERQRMYCKKYHSRYKHGNYSVRAQWNLQLFRT